MDKEFKIGDYILVHCFRFHSRGKIINKKDHDYEIKLYPDSEFDRLESMYLYGDRMDRNSKNAKTAWFANHHLNKDIVKNFMEGIE